MKNIFKILAVLFLPLLLLSSCREETDKNWTTPEASFKLYDTTLGAAVLYPTMEENPFVLSWDKSATGSTYKVVVSATEDFASKVELGTSTKTTFVSSVGDLNMALLQAGLNPYGMQDAFIRVEEGTSVSNSIKFTVTPYPADIPVITSPTAGKVIVLDATKPTEIAATVKWTDYTYSGDVNYTVEIAPKGSLVFTPAGSTINVKELSWTNFQLNDAALKLGFAQSVAADMDIRVTAKTTSVGGEITKTSKVVTVSVTPYQPAFVDFYLVGGGTAVGWNAPVAQKLFRNNDKAEIYTYLQNDGEFRFLGQMDWNPINYSLNAEGINASYKFFNTWSSNLTPSGSENMKFSGNSGTYKITIDQNSRDITITPSAIPTLPSEVFLVGSLTGWNPATSLPMEQVGDGEYEYVIAIPDGAEFKFLGQQSWGDLEWANIHTDGNSGFLGPKGDNNNIKFNGGGSMYKITANIKMGIFKITPQ